MNHGKRLLLLPIIIFAFVFALVALSRLSAFAQEFTYDVTVSPVFFDLSTNPGGSVSDKVRVRNNTTSPINVKVQVNKLTGDETGSLTISDTNDESSSLNWFSFEKTEYRLAPLEWTNIPFTIAVPDTAAYGYYYTINFNQAGVEETGENGATITGAVAVPVLLNVRKDGAIAQAKLTKFSTNSYINEYLPVDFKVAIENTGNIHIRPRGNIFISGNGQDNINTIDVNQTNGAIIPNSTRIFSPSWTNGFIVRVPVEENGQVVTDKNGNPKTKIKINWNQLTDFRFGKYTANLIIVYDNGERDVPIEGSVAFWVIPYKEIIGGIVLIIVIVLGARFLLKRYINKEVKKRSSR